MMLVKCLIDGFYVEVMVFVDEVCVYFDDIGCDVCDGFVLMDCVVFSCELLKVIMCLMYVVVWLLI